MRKSLFAFVVLAVLALAVPASAQYRVLAPGYIPSTIDGVLYKLQGNQLQMLEADNLGMVSGLTDQLRRSGFRSLTDDLRWSGVAYGIQTATGFIPMYDRNRKPMSQKRATITGAVLGGAAGAGVGYLASGSGHGTLLGTGIGAGVGAFVGFITHRGQGNKDVVVTPPEQQQARAQQQQQQNVYWSHGAPVAVGTRPGVNPGTASAFWGPGAPSSSGHPNCLSQEMATLENQGSGPLRVYQNGKRFDILLPKEQKCAPLEGNYTGEIVGTIIGSDGLTGRVGTAPAKPESRPGLVLVWR